MSQQQFEFQQTEQTGQEGLNRQHEQNEEQNRPSDYVAAAPLGGQKIYPQSPRRRRRGLGALLVILIILALLAGSGYISNAAMSKSANLPERSLHVNGTPTIVINDATGSVKIHSGSSDSVVLNATAHGGLLSNLSGDQVKMTENADDSVVTIAVSEDGSIFNHGNVDLNITLPQNSSVQAQVNAGTLDINGVSGKMDLKVNAGTVSFENGTLAGGSVFDNNAGTINFRGLLAPGGNYLFENGAGGINLYLQESPSFTLDASAKLGHVNNKFGTNTVGSGPYDTHISARTNAGNVNVQQA